MVASIEQRLTSERSAIASWKRHQIQKVEEEERRFGSDIKKHKEKVNVLMVKENTYAEEAQKILREVEHEKEEEFNLENSMHALRVTESALPDSIKELETKEQHLAEELTRTRMSASAMKANTDETLAELYKSLRCFEQLGLTFEINSSGLIFSFTQIDENRPSDPFCFALIIDGDTNDFTMTKCSPEVTGTSAMLQRLNNSNGQELGWFVRSMRKSFKELAAVSVPLSESFLNDMTE